MARLRGGPFPTLPANNVNLSIFSKLLVYKGLWIAALFKGNVVKIYLTPYLFILLRLHPTCGLADGCSSSEVVFTLDVSDMQSIT